MPNIFDGLRKISDNDMIEQIALLETMNISNISRPVLQKAKKKTISIINFIGSKIKKHQIIDEPEVKDIWTLINEKKNELKDCTREELDERLFKILKEKVKNDSKDPTEGVISIEVIEEASKLYKMNENSTPSQKADNIYLRYSENLNGKAKEYLEEQPIIDLQETTKDVEEIINNMNEEQRRDFEQSVEIEELTFLNVWKRLNRQHFARLIWLAVKAYDGNFTPKKEVLPSFVEEEREIEELKREEELKKSQEELIELKKKIELYKDKVNNIETNIQKENRLLNKAIKDKDQAKEDIINLGKMKAKLENIRNLQEEKLQEIKAKMNAAVLEELESLMEEFKNVKFDIVDVNNKISDINIEAQYKNELIENNIKIITSKEKSIKDVTNDFQQLKLKASSLISTYSQKKEEVNNKEEQYKNEIFQRWERFFNKFIFEFDNLNNVINFSRKELIHIEECLYELHFTKDPMALSFGIIEDKDENREKKEYQYIDVIFPDNFQIEIQYKVLNNQEKNIQIVDITTDF
jgi:hypothetical protein